MSATPLRVLLVEDSNALVEHLTDMIGQVEDVKVIGAVDTEAAAVVALHRGNVDVMILDLSLKSGTGFGVMRSLAVGASKVQIIVLTNNDLPEYKRTSLSLGATHFLDKARDYHRLPALLQQICLSAGAHN